MGLATILIIFFHSSVEVSSIAILDFLKQICDIGVDIFLLLSGYGMYHSLSKNRPIKQFYKARFYRIVPEFLSVALVWYAIINFVTNDFGVISYLKDITTLSFWLDRTLSSWFIAAILVFYIFSPIIFKIINKNAYYGFFISLISVVIGVLIFHIQYNLIYLALTLYRLPIFLIGFIWAKTEKSFISTRKTRKIIFIVLSVISFILLWIILINHSIPYFFKYLFYIPITILVCSIPIKLPNKINYIISIIGKISLETYLLFEKILYCLTIIGSIFAFQNLWIINIIAIAVTILCGYILKNIWSNLFKINIISKNNQQWR